MSALTIYTADYDPQPVYTTEDTPATDAALVEQAVRYGDSPLDVLVEFDPGGNRVVWSFRGKRGADTNRTESFVADFTAPPEDPLFEAFAAALRSLPDDWIVPPVGDLRWDLGFSLWRLPGATPGLDAAARARLFEELAAAPTTRDEPLVFGMSTHRAALEAVRALQSADVACRVAVASDSTPTAGAGIDLVLVPDGHEDFAPLSASAATLLGPDRTAAENATPRSPAGGRREAEGAEPPSRGGTRAASAVAIAVSVFYLSGAVVLSRGNADPVLILLGTGGGVAATGLALGALRVRARRPWVGATTLGGLGVAGLGAGGVALLHFLGVISSGSLATIVAGAYLGAVVSAGLYAAGTTILDRGRGVDALRRSL